MSVTELLVEPFRSLGDHDGVRQTEVPNVDELAAQPPSGFIDVYSSDRVRLVSVATGIVGSGAVAEELVQDAFVKLAAQGNKVEQPSAYVYRVVVNLCLHHLRRRRLERKHEPTRAELVWPQEIDETWAAVKRLAARQRAVVILRFYDDLSERDIAELLGWPSGTVKSTLSRALKRLQEDLK